MARIIIITVSVLILCLVLILWVDRYPAENLAWRISKSKNFIAYNKLQNESFRIITANSHHRRDSIQKERTNHVFNYSFQDKDTLPVIPEPDMKMFLKKNMQQSFIYFKKINLQFPELRKLSVTTRIAVFRKAREYVEH